jgi:hypothetical protein
MTRPAQDVDLAMRAINHAKVTSENLRKAGFKSDIKIDTSDDDVDYYQIIIKANIIIGKCTYAPDYHITLEDLWEKYDENVQAMESWFNRCIKVKDEIFELMKNG